MHLLFVLNIVDICCRQQHVCASDGCHYSVLIKEEIYMQQPPGYELPGKEKLVCLQAQKSLYNLRNLPDAGISHFMISCSILDSSRALLIHVCLSKLKPNL